MHWLHRNQTRIRLFHCFLLIQIHLVVAVLRFPDPNRIHLVAHCLHQNQNHCLIQIRSCCRTHCRKHFVHQIPNHLVVVVLHFHFQNRNRNRIHLAHCLLLIRNHLVVVVLQIPIHFRNRMRFDRHHQIPSHLVVHYLHQSQNRLVVVLHFQILNRIHLVVPQIHFRNRTRFDQYHQILSHLVVVVLRYLVLIQSHLVRCLHRSRNRLVVVVVLRYLDQIQIHFRNRMRSDQYHQIPSHLVVHCLHRYRNQMVVVVVLQIHFLSYPIQTHLVVHCLRRNRNRLVVVVLRYPVLILSH